MKFIKQHLTNILLVVAIVTFGLAAFFLWFYSGLNYRFDSTVFSNIVTPIATIISAALFLLLAFRQNAMIKYQTDIVQSQNLKPHYEKEFERIHGLLNKKANTSYEFSSEMTPLNFFSTFSDILTEIDNDAEYNADLNAYNPEFKDLKPKSFYAHKKYFKKVNFLLRYLLWGFPHQDLLVEFIKEINESKLHEDDKVRYKKRIKYEFLDNYFDFMEDLETIYREVQLPNFYKSKNGVSYHKVGDFKGFKKYQEFFVKQVGRL